MGASLNPTYFAERINLFVALAPVASTSNIPIWWIRVLANHWEILKLLVVDLIGYYNWFAPMPRAQELVIELCDFVTPICNAFGDIFFDGTNNRKRFDVFMSNEPSGQSYRTFVYYAQMIKDGQYFRMYDYGRSENKKIYGQRDPPLVPIENFNIPTVLLSGDVDRLADPDDVAWISQKLGDKVVF